MFDLLRVREPARQGARQTKESTASEGETIIVYVEPPPGWGPRQKLLTEMERLGYRVEMVGAGERWRLVLS